MAEPFKNFLNQNTVRDIARALHAAWPQFARKGFEAQAIAGLDPRELKALIVSSCGSTARGWAFELKAGPDAIGEQVTVGSAGPHADRRALASP